MLAVGVRTEEITGGGQWSVVPGRGLRIRGSNG